MGWPKHEPNPEALVAECLAQREFSVIAARPAEMPHASCGSRSVVFSQCHPIAAVETSI
jgi:hypothetical protein